MENFSVPYPDKICCIGAGYVGVPTMVMIAVKCPWLTITVVDIDVLRISSWNSDTLPLYEPGLYDKLILCRNVNLFFSSDIPSALDSASIVFVCVNTPTKQGGVGAGRAVDLGPWEMAGRAIGESTGNKIIVEKSTVPVRTAETLNRVLKTSKSKFCILSNPEFLAEGSAMGDLEFPDRVLIGGHSEYAINILVDIYSTWVPSERIVTTNLWSAELGKLVANAFLAQRVSSINSVALLCERTGAEIDQVAIAIGTDSRIGSKFLTPSVGFGGSCFRKDILSLVYLCEQLGGLQPVADYWNAVLLMNEFRKFDFASQITSAMFGNLRGKKIAVLGFAFKKNTCDTRESPAISICQHLALEGADLHVYDPQVTSFGDLKFSVSVESAVSDSHAIVILTEWDEFKLLPFDELFVNMRKPAFVFDGRNILNHKQLEKIGFIVHTIGSAPNTYVPPYGG